MTKPNPNEYAAYYSRYVDLVSDGDIITTLENQLQQTEDLFRTISSEKSLHSYAPEKWTIRELTGHVNDTERVFAFRALWFARRLPGSLPSLDQNSSVRAASSNNVAWPDLIDEFCNVRRSTISLFRGLPEIAWTYSGVASDNEVTVRALAYIIAGHVTHHLNVLNERYL